MERSTALVISAPLWSGRRSRQDLAGAAERADLEAARDAKYAEIRDAEMDFRTAPVVIETLQEVVAKGFFGYLPEQKAAELSAAVSTW